MVKLGVFESASVSWQSKSDADDARSSFGLIGVQLFLWELG